MRQCERELFRILMLCSVAWISSACGSEGGIVSPSTDAGSVDGIFDAQTSDAPVPTDTGAPDTREDIEEPECQEGEGCFGEVCNGADDCLSGICTMHLGAKVCSKTCDSACPEGWSCTLVGSGGDGQYACISNFSHLCLPCASSESCSGESPNVCVNYPDGMSFCGGSCGLEIPCPEGYGCQEVKNTSGGTSFQCVPKTGMCPCSEMAVTLGLSTPCTVENDIGTCHGVRLCTDEGLSECDAAPAAAELCDGLDNDCNGLIDDNTCDDGNACTKDTCGGEGGCTHEPLDQGECLDGDACTQGDHCEAGSCVGDPIICFDDNACTDDGCDHEKGCQYTPNNDPCDDGEACTVNDTCKAGDCSPGILVECDDGNPCTDDACGEAGCVFTPNSAECDDMNICTSSSVCEAGMCLGSGTTACDDGNVCTNDGCDLEQGCIHIPNSAPCDDGDMCSIGDVCSEGACATGGSMLTCEDGNPCTDDACDKELGCLFLANDAECDDKNTCTTGDACFEGTCLGVGSLLCDDGNPCTLDTCVPGGGCEHSPAEGACTDGDPCTINDFCENGQCISPATVSCDDGNPCTDEVCEAGDCVFTPNGADCDDGNACSTGESCAGGSCKPAASLSCDDDNPCTHDGCDPATGCTTTNNSLPCEDGDPCTLADICEAGECAAGVVEPNCDDGNPCTDDGCDPETGCTHTFNTAACDDGNACSTGDFCSEGQCLGPDTLDCDDDNPCTDDGCDPQAGCQSTHNNDACNDGNPCTVGDTCQDGSCQAGPDPLECNDGNPCTADSCNPDTGCESASDATLGESCCVTGDDCLANFAAAPSCEDVTTCQGKRTDALCVESMCDSVVVADDSGCAELLSDACGSYADVFCSADSEQNAPECGVSCQSDNDCDADAHCDENVCLPDSPPGGACDENSDCESNICEGGACCAEACSESGCGILACDETGACMSYTDGEQHGCDVCQACGDSGCEPALVEGIAATQLGCNAADEACRKCDANGCGFHTSGQHGCPANHVCNASGLCENNAFTGEINMPQDGTVNGYSSYWQCSGNMRTTTRVKLSEACNNPTIAIHQHVEGDTSIQGSYYILAEGGEMLGFSPFETHGGCSNCYLTPTKLAGITLNADTFYHLGFQNDASKCDMCCPSVYPDSAQRTVGIAVFDNPRMDQPGHLERGLPGSNAGWQNRWQIICE